MPLQCPGEKASLGLCDLQSKLTHMPFWTLWTDSDYVKGRKLMIVSPHRGTIRAMKYMLVPIMADLAITKRIHAGPLCSLQRTQNTVLCPIWWRIVWIGGESEYHHHHWMSYFMVRRLKATIRHRHSRALLAWNMRPLSASHEKWPAHCPKYSQIFSPTLRARVHRLGDNREFCIYWVLYCWSALALWWVAWV